jgi:hypothetical protein
MSARACCGNCRHFSNDPVQLECALPGLGALGSAHGAVRDQDGICGKHERYLRASSVCAGHEFTGPVAAGIRDNHARVRSPQNPAPRLPDVQGEVMR